MENSIEPMTEGLLTQSNFTSDYADQIEDFRLAIQKAGLPPPAKIVSDGLFHRFPTNGRPKDDAGWYVLQNQPFPAGSFGCWRTGIKGSWSSIDSSKMTGTERRKFNEILEQIRITNDQKRHESQVEAALSAKRIWDEAQDASSNHPYLKRKGIPAYGLREKDQKLIIPLYNVKGELMNLQRIFNDGRKRFLKNAQVKGLFFVIGNSNGVIYLGEGYATMASVHNATGSTCVAAFNANNLVHVGRELRKKYPEAEIILCADDDHTVQGNPGLAKARETAEMIDAGLVVPDFGDGRRRDHTDFNDLHLFRGLEAVRSCVQTNQIKAEALKNDSNSATDWESDPEPVLPLKQSAAPFPIEHLPSIIREAVVETLEYTQVPIALACSTAIGVAAASVQHLAMVARDQQTIGPLSLYVLSILRSGERKSTIFRKMWKGFRDRQSELFEEWNHYERNADEDDDPLLEGESHPRLLFEDATVQGLALDIDTGIKSVLLSSSEGGTVFGGVGMRGDALMGAMAFLNKAWDAEPQSMTRKQAVSTYLDLYRLSCLISTQRETLKEWLNKSIGLAEGMGFLARFLICVPETTIGNRLYVPAPEETPKLDLFNDICLNHLRTRTDLGQLPVIHLSKKAHKEWVEYFNFVEAAQGQDGPYEYNTAVASKSAEQAARMAGVFTLYGDEDLKVIDEEEMVMGISVAKWFLDESMGLQSEIGISHRHHKADELLNWLKRLKQDDEQPLLLSELIQLGPRCIRTKKDRDEAVETLSNHGWIKKERWENKNIIQLHPSIRSHSWQV